MLKKSKLFIGVLTSMTLVFTSITTAFAEENVVSKTQDNITVTKTAEWTTVDGKSTDASGNRYAKINFKIDTTNATTEITNTVSKGGDTDIVLILDDSGSMSGERVRKLKETANDFINTMLSIPDTKVRLGVVAFKKYDAEILSPMSQDKAALTGSLSKLIAECGADNPLQCGIKKGHEMLNGSTAANKFFVVLSDGGIYTYPQAEELSIQYLQQAQAQYPELKAISIGFEPYQESDREYLKKFSSKRSDGTPMYYDAGVTATSVLTDLGDVFKQISEQITSYVIGNSLVDTIPAQFSIVEGSITSNDTKLAASVSEDKKTITWNWGENKLEKKVYEASVVVVLDKTQVPADYTKVNTNGTTIDPSADSSQSAVFSYGSTNRIYLESPKLSLAQEVTVEDEKAPLTGSQTDATPATGDSLNTGIFVVLGLCGAVVVISGVMVAKKRRNF